jgi:predicted phosphodiesterase
MTAIALLSDVHANLPALEAVATDLRARRPDAVYVLGDIVNGCPWPNEVLDLLADTGWGMLLGNHDDAVIQLGTPRMEARYADRERYGPLWWTREHLDACQLDLLNGLPLELGECFPGTPPIRLVHGVPGNFFVGLRPDSPEAWVQDQLAGVSERVLAAGHTHFPMVRMIPAPSDQRTDVRLVLNCGSVGIPYDGDSRAGYLWLEARPDEWRAEIRRLDYDRQLVANAYAASGLALAGGVLGEMVLRSVMTGLPWVSDFGYWMRQREGDSLTDIGEAKRLYDRQHGPGRWAFPFSL